MAVLHRSPAVDSCVAALVVADSVHLENLAVRIAVACLVVGKEACLLDRASLLGQEGSQAACLAAVVGNRVGSQAAFLGRHRLGQVLVGSLEVEEACLRAD